MSICIAKLVNLFDITNHYDLKNGILL